MKAVQIIARSQPVFVNAPVPALRPGHALIKTLRLSLCGSDIRHLHYLPDERYPTEPGDTGHEMVGIIDAIDAPEGDFQVGDHVLALAPDHRAMAEYYLAPVEHLIPIDNAVPLEHSVQAQQLGTVLYAAQSLPDVRGKSVAVIGQGSAGLYFNLALRERGAAKIIALDLKQYRLAYSRRYGATHTLHNANGSPLDAILALNGGTLPDVVVEAAGEEASIALAVDIARDNGFILLFGVPRFEWVRFPYLQFFWKTLSAKAIVHATRDPDHACTRQALEWIRARKVDVASMITHTFKFEDVMQAYELHHLQDEGAVKIVIDMEA